MDPHPQVIPPGLALGESPWGPHREPHEHLIPPHKFTNGERLSNLPLKVPLKAPFKAPSTSTNDI